jgi:hypothetical protein
MTLMKSKGDNEDKSGYEQLNDAIAETVSSTPELAREFLIEEGKDVDKIVESGLALVRRLQAETRNKLAVEKRLKRESMLTRFFDWVKEKGDLIKPQSHELRLNYRGLEVEGLDEEEKDRIIEDALYLQFLEEIEKEEHD